MKLRSFVCMPFWVCPLTSGQLKRPPGTVLASLSTQGEHFIGVSVLPGLESHWSRFTTFLLRNTFWPVCLSWVLRTPEHASFLTLPLYSPQDYWLSLLYKRLVGPKVLAVHVAGLQRKPRPGRVIRDKLRIYAHCTSHHK